MIPKVDLWPPCIHTNTHAHTHTQESNNKLIWYKSLLPLMCEPSDVPQHSSGPLGFFGLWPLLCKAAEDDILSLTSDWLTTFRAQWEPSSDLLQQNSIFHRSRQAVEDCDILLRQKKTF